MSGGSSRQAEDFLLSPKISIGNLQRHLVSLGPSFSSLQCRSITLLNGEEWSEIVSPVGVVVTPHGSPVTLSRLVVKSDGSFSFETLFTQTTSGNCYGNLGQLDQYLADMLPSPTKKFCPGLVDYEEISESIRFDSKNVRKWQFPFSRIDAGGCCVWHQLAKNCPLEERFAVNVMCKECKLLHRQLSVLKQRAQDRPEDAKAVRCSATSNIPYKFISPVSRTQRIDNLRDRSRQLGDRIKRLEHLIIELSSEQSDQLEEVCRTIADQHADVLDAVIGEVSDGVADVLHRTWKEDTALGVFNSDQQKNVTGRTTNRWSILTYRMALAVYSRSPAAYEALKSFNVLQLPSSRSLKHFTSAQLQSPGGSEESLAFQYQKYEKFKEERVAAGQKVPLGEGLLVFDEVKVVARVMWNSRSNEIYGLAMTPESFSSLQDVYDDISPENTARTQYVLQFLWRDLSAGYDIIGPYYTLQKSLDSKFIQSCVLHSMRLFHSYRFKTAALVCDGASTNVSMFKTLVGHRGSFGLGKPGSEDQVPHSMDHPYWLGRKLYFIICPSHQLKNMVNALHSSSSTGTKAFVTADGTPFGWQTILDLHQREMRRQETGVPRLVPGLRKNFIHRDAWTKLNVLPAKIMQQDKVLTELFCYAAEQPVDAANVSATLGYLSACHLMFEKGTLSHEKITSKESAPMQSIKQGLDFFTKWLVALRQADPDFQITNSQQKKFISWQTWDLLRLLSHGFLALCEDFVTRHPGYYVVPVRVSGSAVETLFSQAKGASGGRLSGVNYSTAIASVSLQRNIHPVHPSGKDYRDATLHFSDLSLPRK